MRMLLCLCFILVGIGSVNAQTNQLVLTDTEGTNTVDFAITALASDEYLYGTLAISSSLNGGPFIQYGVLNTYGDGSLVFPGYIASGKAYMTPSGSFISLSGTMPILCEVHTTNSPIYSFDGAPVSTNTQQVVVDMKPSIIQGGTAGYTVLRLETLTTSSGSGNKRLLDFGSNGLKGNVDVNGNMTLSGSVSCKSLVFPDGSSLQSIGKILYYITSTQTNIVSDGR